MERDERIVNGFTPNKNSLPYQVICPLNNSVKPVYNGHPWDPKIMAVVHRLLFLEDFQ
jgi:hypothetical protein